MQLRQIIVAGVAAIMIHALPASADEASVAAEIKAAMYKLNDAFAAQDVNTIESMVTADHLGVSSYYGRPLDTEEQIDTIGDFKAEYFDFTDPVVTVLGPNAAQITFENSFKGTFEDKPLPPRVFVSEIWLKQDGKWLQQLYQETPVDAK